MATATKAKASAEQKAVARVATRIEKRGERFDEALIAVVPDGRKRRPILRLLSEHLGEDAGKWMAEQRDKRRIVRTLRVFAES